MEAARATSALALVNFVSTVREEIKEGGKLVVCEEEQRVLSIWVDSQIVCMASKQECI